MSGKSRYDESKTRKYAHLMKMGIRTESKNNEKMSR